MFGEVALARAGMILTAVSLALLPLANNLTILLLVSRRALLRQRHSPVRR